MQTIERETLVEQVPAPETLPVNGHEPAMIPNGEAFATFLAAGIGVLTMGIMTTVAAASTNFANMLKFNNGVGPLSGKTVVTVAVWLVAWAALYFYYKGKQVDFSRMFLITLGLITLGILGTFPSFFDLFAP